MIFSLIIKNWKSILDVGIIVAIILLIFLWNPFNIFGTGLKLQDTANMVSEIKEIGELITAEYYGEVIATDKLQEIEIEDPTHFEDMAADYYLDLKMYLYTTYMAGYEDAENDVAEIKRDRKRRRKFASKINILKNDLVESYIDTLNLAIKNKEQNVWMAMMLFASKTELGLDPNVKRFANKYKEDPTKLKPFVKRTLRKMLSKELENTLKFIDGNPVYANYPYQGFTSAASFQNFYYNYLDEDVSKKDRYELALIGRGSVKAGFKFGEMNEKNLVYDDVRKTVHFFGFQAEILNQDINPWFIPEAKVAGFDILLAEGKVEFEDMKRVKSNCIKLLKENAIKAGIIEQAQENGQEAMKEFFGLLLDKEIKEVVFHNDPLTYQSDQILDNDTIDIAELSTIENLYQRNLKAIENEKNPTIKTRRQNLLKDFLLSLKKVKYVENLTGKYQFNFYTRHIPELLADSMITDNEWPLIAGLRHDPTRKVLKEIKTMIMIEDTVFTDQDTTINKNEVPIVKKDSIIQYSQIPPNWMYWFEDSLQYLVEYNQFTDQLTSEANGFNGFYYQNVISKDTVGLANELETRINSLKKKFMANDHLIYGDSIKLIRSSEVVDIDLLNKYPLNENLEKDSITTWKRLVEFDTFEKVVVNDTINFVAIKSDTLTVNDFYANLVFKPYKKSNRAKLSPMSIASESMLDDNQKISFDVVLSNDTDSVFSWTRTNDQVNEVKIGQGKINNLIIGNSINTLDKFPVVGIKYLKYLAKKTPALSGSLKNTFYVLDKKADSYVWISLQKSLLYLKRNNQSSAERVPIAKQLLYVDSIETLLKSNGSDELQFFKLVELKQLTDLAIARQEREIQALKNYLVNRNKKYNDIGPVMRARRRLDRYIEQDSTISETIKSVSVYGKKLAKNVRETVGIK